MLVQLCVHKSPASRENVAVWDLLLRDAWLHWAARLTKLEKQENGNASTNNAYLTGLFQNIKPTHLLLDQHFFVEQENGSNIQYRNQMEIRIFWTFSNTWKSNHSMTETRNKRLSPPKFCSVTFAYCTVTHLLNHSASPLPWGKSLGVNVLRGMSSRQKGWAVGTPGSPLGGVLLALRWQVGRRGHWGPQEKERWSTEVPRGAALQQGAEHSCSKTRRGCGCQNWKDATTFLKHTPCFNADLHWS